MPEDKGSQALALATQVRKIEFVEFTNDLVRNVYSTIVTSSMDQLRAYAEFVRQVSKSVAEYQQQVTGKTSAEQNATADTYIKDVLKLDPSQSSFTFKPEEVPGLKEHFAGIKRPTDNKTIGEVITADATTGSSTISRDDLRVFVIEKLNSQAKDSYEILKTILKIGMQKIVVSDGVIETKLTFHIDASDVQSRTATEYQSRASGWGIGGGISGRYTLGGLVGVLTGSFIGGGISGGYSSRTLNVSVVNETSYAALNVRVDIIGGVKINFRTETFPAPPIS